MALIQGKLNSNINIGSVQHCMYDVTDCVDDDFDTFSSNIRRMKQEENRLDSFKQWPVWSNQSAQKLAEAGLYFTGVGDRVRCPFCHGILKKWQPWDIPLDEHRRHFPRCPFIRGEDVGNIPLRQNSFKTQPTRQGSNSCMYTTRPAGKRVECAHSFNLLDFTREVNRLATYERWPSNMSQTPESLARAGFYHIPTEGKMDRVECAYCQGKLYNWAESEEPWTEHARCFPDCPYVRLCVNGVDIENLQKDSSDRTRVGDSDSSSSSLAVRETPDDVTEYLSSAAVKAVLEIGFPLEQVKQVLTRHCKTGSLTDLSAHQLTCELLEME